MKYKKTAVPDEQVWQFWLFKRNLLYVPAGLGSMFFDGFKALRADNMLDAAGIFNGDRRVNAQLYQPFG